MRQHGKRLRYLACWRALFLITIIYYMYFTSLKPRYFREAITIFSVLARIVSHYNYLLYVFRFIETKIRVSTLNCVFGVLARTGSGSDYNISVLAHIVSHDNYLLYVYTRRPHRNTCSNTCRNTCRNNGTVRNETNGSTTWYMQSACRHQQFPEKNYSDQ